MDKLIKFSRIGCGFSKALKILAWVSCGLMAASLVFICITKDTSGLMFKVGGVSFYAPVEMTGHTVEQAICALSAGIASLFFGGFILLNLEQVLCDMKNGRSPFTMENVRRIRFMAYYMLAGLVAGGVVQGILEGILSVELDYEFSIGSIGVVGLIYVLSFVFEYGVTLQTQVDETL